MRFAYLFINKISGLCFQVNRNNKENWVVDNAQFYNKAVNPKTASQYLGKYFLNGVWFWREYTELDEYGNPVEGSPHIDHIWYPDGEE